MAGDLESIIHFTVSGQPFALSVDVVREVVPIAWMAKPVGMPSIVHGVLNLGGVAVPVLRADLLLGLVPFALGLDASVLIMKGAEPPLGLLVEHVEGVRSAAAYGVLPLNEAQSFRGCVEAQLDGAGEVLPLLSWPRLLLEEERTRLAEFQQRSAKRLDEMAEGLS
jgi:purine-binding chemotaxis protein CheW